MYSTDRDEIRAELKSKLPEYVQRITPGKSKKNRNQECCPICGSGSGSNGTSAFNIYENGTKWRCFSCEKGGDIFDLIGEVEGISDKLEQLKRAGEIFCIETERPGSERQRPQRPQAAALNTAEQEADYTSFFLEANKHINGTDYHRGLSAETLNRFKVGYVAAWRHPKVSDKVPTSPRLIIPTSKGSYLARDTRAELTPEQKEYSKSKVGKCHIFNEKALQHSEKPIYIVEGEIDAMSIIEVGGEAVGLGSISYIRQFLEAVEKAGVSQKFIIALDKEKDQKKQEKVDAATQKLKEGLAKLGKQFIEYSPAGEHHDSNDALIADRESFREAVQRGETLDPEQEEREAYINTSAAGYMIAFLGTIAEGANTPSIPTGFSKLDKALEGGLYEGLYIMGAISSLGKTTFILQAADQIAAAGYDVLIFSLEMARYELMAKSISRHTIQEVLQSGGDTRHAKTTRGITAGARYEYYTPKEKELINKACNDYSQYAEHVFISEGIGDIGADQIREAVQNHVRITGNKPVVIIDYLQILAPADVRATDKQNTDKAVLELKRISRDYKIPVIGISSFNRENYNTEVSMRAFKESGAIEYSSDVLLGLQLKGTGEKGFDEKAAKEQTPREVELVVLKNRNGKTGIKIVYQYFQMFNYFVEE